MNIIIKKKIIKSNLKIFIEFFYTAIKIGKICLEDRDCKWNDNNDLICVFQNTVLQKILN